MSRQALDIHCSCQKPSRFNHRGGAVSTHVHMESQRKILYQPQWRIDLNTIRTIGRVVLLLKAIAQKIVATNEVQLYFTAVRCSFRLAITRELEYQTSKRTARSLLIS